jgi:hypothetical protein
MRRLGRARRARGRRRGAAGWTLATRGEEDNEADGDGGRGLLFGRNHVPAARDQELLTRGDGKGVSLEKEWGLVLRQIKSESGSLVSEVSRDFCGYIAVSFMTWLCCTAVGLN